MGPNKIDIYRLIHDTYKAILEQVPSWSKRTNTIKQLGKLAVPDEEYHNKRKLVIQVGGYIEEISSELCMHATPTAFFRLLHTTDHILVQQLYKCYTYRGEGEIISTEEQWRFVPECIEDPKTGEVWLYWPKPLKDKTK